MVSLRRGAAQPHFSLCSGMSGEVPTSRSMRPGLASAERKIIGIGGLAARRLLGFDDLIGNALALAIGDRLFPRLEAQRQLLLHVGRAGPAHQRLDDSGLLGLIV